MVPNSNPVLLLSPIGQSITSPVHSIPPDYSNVQCGDISGGGGVCLPVGRGSDDAPPSSGSSSSACLGVVYSPAVLQVITIILTIMKNILIDDLEYNLVLQGSPVSNELLMA